MESEETCTDNANASSTLSPRPRRADLRYVEFDAAGVTDAGSGRIARLARGILLPSEVRALAEVVLGFTPDPRHLDSTDGLPAYETYIRHKGVDTHPAAASMLPQIEARFGVFLAEHYGCVSCHLCSVLLRRYQATERVQVKTHFDRMAFVTAVASLNPSEFEGGLFLQRTPRADSREYFSTSATDAAFHSYDLEHGVDVLEGRRLSAVFWITDSAASCRDDASPWYEAPAAAGVMDAQDALGELHQLGTHGYARDANKAAEWATKAAEQGHAPAQSRLGRLYLAGEGVPRDAQLGLEWVRRAAAQGYAPAEHTMGVACQYGDAEGGLEAAARWFRGAAEAGVASSQYELGVALVNGDGVEMDRREGAEMLWRAAQQGNAEAKADLRALADAGVIESGEELDALIGTG